MKERKEKEYSLQSALHGRCLVVGMLLAYSIDTVHCTSREGTSPVTPDIRMGCKCTNWGERRNRAWKEVSSPCKEASCKDHPSSKPTPSLPTTARWCLQLSEATILQQTFILNMLHISLPNGYLVCGLFSPRHIHLHFSMMIRILSLPFPFS